MYLSMFSFLFSDLEREVESVKEQYKNNNNSSEDSTLIQVCLEAGFNHVSALHIPTYSCVFFLRPRNANHVAVCFQ